MLPNRINSTPPAPPTKLSYSCDVTLNKKETRKLYRLLFPLTRPAQVSPRKKVAWRLVRKWFNRYEKPNAIGKIVVIGQHDGQQTRARITDVRIVKASGHLKSYEYSLTPII